jgi:hypothetical protein
MFNAHKNIAEGPSSPSQHQGGVPQRAVAESKLAHRKIEKKTTEPFSKSDPYSEDRVSNQPSDQAALEGVPDTSVPGG